MPFMSKWLLYMGSNTIELSGTGSGALYTEVTTDFTVCSYAEKFLPALITGIFYYQIDEVSSEMII